MAASDSHTTSEESGHHDDSEHALASRSVSGTVQHAAMLYGIFLTVVGFILPMSNFVSLKPSPWSLAGFYIAVYALAIVFLVFFIAWVARRPSIRVVSVETEGQNGDAQGAVETAAADSTVDSGSDAGSSTTRRRRGGPDQHRDRANSSLARSASDLDVKEIPAFTMLPQEVAHSPSFFMRAAVIMFGTVKIVQETLMIVDTLTDVTGGCADSVSETAGKLVQYFLSIIFTVLQTYFIFKYSKVSVNVHRTLCVLGFMHLVGTNMCDWFLATLNETSHSSYKSSSRGTGYTAPTYNNSCSREVFWRMAPYLLPFTIEYAMMASVATYALSQNVGKVFQALHPPSGTKVPAALMRFLKRCREPPTRAGAVNCLRSVIGIIIGAVLLVASLVSAIYFTIYLNDKPSKPVASQLIYQGTDLALLSVNLVLCAVAYWKMRRLPHAHGGHEGGGPDAWLLGLTLVGLLAYQLFQLFGAYAEDDHTFQGLRISQALLTILQSLFQTFLIFEVEHRRCSTPEQLKSKPGREELAALMLGNIALWIVYTLEIREISYLPTYPLAYASTAIDIVTYSCSPLIIFFRFHCACCFVEIWSNAYRAHPAPSSRPVSSVVQETATANHNGSKDTVIEAEPDAHSHM